MKDDWKEGRSDARLSLIRGADSARLSLTSIQIWFALLFTFMVISKVFFSDHVQTFLELPFFFCFGIFLLINMALYALIFFALSFVLHSTARAQVKDQNHPK